MKADESRLLMVVLSRWSVGPWDSHGPGRGAHLCDIRNEGFRLLVPQFELGTDWPGRQQKTPESQHTLDTAPPTGTVLLYLFLWEYTYAFQVVWFRPGYFVRLY